MRTDLPANTPTGLFVDGAWRSGGGADVPVEDPATGTILATVAGAGPDDARRALDAAARAQPGWAATPPRVRADLLWRAFELLVERREQFALVMTLEMGKPLAQARDEVTYGAEFFRWFAEETTRVAGRWSTAPDGRSRLLTMKQPVGPTLMVTPWNFPLAMGARKIAPAVAAGCTMVVKPAAQTPLTMLTLAALMHEVGFPAGVVNVLTTAEPAELVAPLLADPRLRKLTFTGSTGVGRELVRQSATQLLRVSMELGGNAPFLVFADADVGAAVDGAIVAKLRNMGEACTAANRFLVHRDVAEEFVELLSARMAAEVVGPGTAPEVTVGPLIDAAARSKVDALVRDALDRGGRLLVGGHPSGDQGYFYAPTVLADVPSAAAVTRHEIFGPVAAITTFTEEAEALALANDTDYGLAAYLYTGSLDRAIRVGEALECGMVGINQGVVSNAAAPFGGTKHSGSGREGGPEGIDEYLETKYLGIAT